MTGRPWHEEHAEEFARVRTRFEAAFPYLHVTSRDAQTVLSGDLPIVLERRVIDKFEIEVVVPAAGPTEALPIVRETGGRIPRTSDRHIDLTTGNACLFVEDEYWYRHPEGMDLVDFLQGPVISFFVAQLAYEREGKWPFGERSHGHAGILEFYADLLGTSNTAAVHRLFEVVDVAGLNGRARCPCGSGRRINVCHGDVIRALRSSVRRSGASYRSIPFTGRATVAAGVQSP